MSYRKPLVKATYSELPSLRNEFYGPFDSLFNDFANSFFNDFSLIKPLSSKHSYPKVDVFREGNDLVFNAAVPGMKKEQLSIEVDDDILTIKGDSQHTLESPCTGDKQSQGCNYIKELKRSSFTRRFTLPKELNISNETIAAKLNDGILEIRFKGAYVEEASVQKTTTITIE